MSNLTIRPIAVSDYGWVRKFAEALWGSDLMVAHGTTYTISQHPGWIAEIDNQPVGLATYLVSGENCELTALGSRVEGTGVGTALIKAVIDSARLAGCARLFLITTNDNTRALRFYQRRGFILAALHRGAVTQARKIKPQIPLLGEDGIPLRDELELEMGLRAEAS